MTKWPWGFAWLRNCMSRRGDLPTIRPPFEPIGRTLARAVWAAGALGNNASELMHSHGPHQFRKRQIEGFRKADRVRW